MQLIGQEKISKWIDELTFETCPRFIILQGGRRSGKTFITEKLAEKLECLKCQFDKSAEQVRHIISTIYNIKEPCVYWCEDLDKMRPEASNALLKVTEETPKNAIIVLHSVGTPLATLKSRAQLFILEPYSFQDYEDYCKEIGIDIPNNAKVLMKSCNSLADFEYYIQTGKFQQAYELADKVLNYIGEVSKVNAFKILKDMALKKDAEGIDPEFFLTVLLNMYVEKQGEVEFGDIIVKCSYKALSSLRNVVLSKQAIMDRWVLEIMKGIDEVC
jgi:predicted AAA+ superfamily ATPase